MYPPGTSGSGVARVCIPATSEPLPGSERQKAARWVPLAIPGRYFCFCASVPAIMIGPVGRRVSRSIKPSTFEYLVTSSMASTRPKMPAPEPPYSSGMQRPSKSALRNSWKMSSGYSPVLSISLARGAIFVWANWRTIWRRPSNSSDNSKSISPRYYPNYGEKAKTSDFWAIWPLQTFPIQIVL